MAQLYRFTDENGQVRLMAEIDPAPGGGPAAGTYLPVADATGVTVDTTTYADPIAGGGATLTALVFASNRGLLAIAKSGDAFPRWLMAMDARDGLYLGSGAFDPYVNGPLFYSSANGDFNIQARVGQQVNIGSPMSGQGAGAPTQVPQLQQVTPLFTITSGALPTLTITSGTGRQINTDRDCETVTPFSGDGTNNAATCAIALSPDNVTYSTLATISVAAALNLTGVLTDNVNVRVPAGWYIKLTAAHGTLGTTTYY